MVSIHVNVALLTKEDFNPIVLYTANEGPVRIQYKCLVPIYVLPEMTISVQNLTQRRYGTLFSAARLYWVRWEYAIFLPWEIYESEFL